MLLTVSNEKLFEACNQPLPVQPSNFVAYLLIQLLLELIIIMILLKMKMKILCESSILPVGENFTHLV